MTKKRILALLALVAVVLALGCPGVSASADDSGDRSIVLLIDKSGSMNQTDAARRNLDCAKMFVDSLYIESLHDPDAGTDGVGFRVGVIAFSNSTEIMTDLTDISSESGLETVKTAIDSISYREINTGGTDMGLSLYEAVDMLCARGDSSECTVVLFSDGYTEAVDEAASENYLSTALTTAQSLGCEVYVVGLSQQGDCFEEEGIDAIHRIANSTQTGSGVASPDADDTDAAGLVNYKITDTVRDVKDFYNAILASWAGTTPVSIVDGVVDLTQPGILYANIYVYCDDGISSPSVVRLFDPDGNEISSDADNLTISSGKYYVILTLTLPQQGIWTLEVEEGINYDASLILVTGVELAMDVQTRGGYGTVTITGTNGGKDLGDEFYSGIQSTTCTAVAGGTSIPVELTYDSTKQRLTGQFTVPSPDTYTVTANLTLAHATRTVSAEVDFVMDTTDISIRLRQLGSADIPLRAYCLDGWDDISLTVNSATWTNDRLLRSATLSGDTLSVRAGLRMGETAVTITAVDGLGQSRTIQGTVTVAFNPLLLVPLVLIAAAVVFFLLRWVKKHNAGPYGEYTIILELRDGGKASARGCQPPRGDTFTIYRLIKDGLTPENPAHAAALRALEEARQMLDSAAYTAHLVTDRNGYHHYTYGRLSAGKRASSLLELDGYLDTDDYADGSPFRSIKLEFDNRDEEQRIEWEERERERYEDADEDGWG